ncbi:S-adenosyl-L-methionine-dependent methyltransferase [Chaetomium tenue]|uniref:S-adenosyl-L-methionine-dependent methyltransferase n=1 Tax=Chaetomium tenue TaxID=1854479 RepID=A0ACB7PD23_9PEZI|nr:S-adenosyl-L-methionine-dependent methyltransferase [Chaetomium globosum]
MTEANTVRFNEEALSWDSNPSVQLATALAHKAYLARLPPPEILSTYDIMDLGCGTGLLSLALAPSVRSVTAIDAAEGMIAALRSKLEQQPPTPGSNTTPNNDPDNNNSPNPPAPPPPTNIHPIHTLLTSATSPLLHHDPLTHLPTPTPRRFDLIVSHLVLHHIPSLPTFFATIHDCLHPGTGRVMVTDFEDFGPAARQFHPESKMDGVERHGIQEGVMREVLEGAGFVDVKVERAFEMGKEVETEPGSGVLGPAVVFPFLICEGRRAA